MAAPRKAPEPSKKRPPATTPEARIKQVVAKAYDLAEKQIEEGTASSQTIQHFLKLGTAREKLEQTKIHHENELLKARVESLASIQRTEEMMKEALQAFRGYAGQDEQDHYED